MHKITARRSGWTDNVRIGTKSFYNSYPTGTLKKDGLGSGKLTLTVPESLKQLVAFGRGKCERTIV